MRFDELLEAGPAAVLDIEYAARATPGGLLTRGPWCEDEARVERGWG